MDTSTLTRLFRSIKGSPEDDIVKIAYNIISREKEKGHKNVANSLLKILESNVTAKREEHSLNPLTFSTPLNSRNNIPLVTKIDREELRHDMILSQEIEKKFLRIEKEYIARDRLLLSGLKPKQKIMFYGPPGCGKSMGAERLAWDIGLPFLRINFEVIISSFLGESLVNLRKVFDQVKTYPCVLLLDEFDFIAKSRDNKQDVGEMSRIVNVMLNLLEDYDSPGIIIATTNLKDSIDTAMFRRFDDVIEIKKPEIEEISQLCKNTLSAMKVSKSINFKLIAKKLVGFSASDIVKLTQNAGKTAVLEGGDTVTMEHLTYAINEYLSR
ncbi:MAG: ATP-binding protein [Candidatus Gracilibacteria bacterium]|nr:ATP-binding protein [Candidatus Gracilibacteria bacterium]